MCQFFSPLVFRTGAIRFCESDNHETLIARLGLDDAADLFMRGWVRVECVPGPDGTFPGVRVDETSVPGWYAEDRVAIDDRVQQLARRVATARRVYEATCAPAWQVYDATCATARQVYEATCAPAWQVYQATRATARRVYEATCAPAWQVYQDAIQSIEGYVPQETPHD